MHKVAHPCTRLVHSSRGLCYSLLSLRDMRTQIAVDEGLWVEGVSQARLK